MSQQKTDPRVIVALDFPSVSEAEAFAQCVSPDLCKLKVGKELFALTGPDFVRQLVARGFDVFLDLKFHDIPNTVAQAVAVAADMGVWMTDLHAMGGRRMMESSRNILEQRNSAMQLIAVTVLTSMGQNDLHELGITASPHEQVLRLASLAHQSGMHGVVSSAMEAESLRNEFGEDFTLVTPGIRPANGNTQDDQRRVVTPEDAIRFGSSYLVIGRPITRSENPLETLAQINREISQS